MNNRNLIRYALSLLLMLGGHAVFAQGLSIDITDGSRTADPIAVVPFAFEGAGLPPETDVSEVLRADLARSGKFFTLAKRDIVEFPTRESEVKYPTWRLLKQNYLVVGRIADAGDGALRVEFELFDVARQSRMIGLAISGQRTAMRDVAHQIADLVYEKILGVRGAFWTRIAYVTSVGLGQNTQYALMVADSDGFNPQVVVRSREPLMSPAWSPDGRRLAYVSFERGNSSIYMQDLSTGSRELLSAQKGINGGPAFSPDGSRLAMNLSYAGNPDIYIMDLASRKTSRVTSHFAIDVEAVWAPDGRSLVFTSDRSGKPQLYEVPVSGGDASRLTFQGQYNARATICCDGKKIAMAQGTGNVYRIAVFDRATGTYSEISPGNVDESPSFAPNGSMVLYAATEGPRGVLYAVSADGRVRQRLVLADGDVREPAWGPFRQR
ncbi:MAG: Tol-Pal system beta propeller repeat protein TolB [Dokdonella sp.]|uniref:Tol-Pal system beta propeller repeat protein TolB n=1 Tax=Dokdonella sp. TaxID=2291710 RepID=UPI002BBCBE42|nr:Tol-Pal system beta propeller repeat protein TolB [Dokdonella sp.]HOX70282.1 Tol-Pal system beta propeller repeat protein TolB [Dokdonella sp.]HPG93613.1 Tol-Pal system beta propeller repeat protein TolB [Dokdonella sp.]HPN80893.1 Tol-Pal system beta propeller repeat protein TolB [Dokdonella sp.]